MSGSQIIHTYHSRFISEGVAQVSRIFLPDAHVLLKLLSYEEYYRRDRWQADGSVHIYHKNLSTYIFAKGSLDRQATSVSTTKFIKIGSAVYTNRDFFK
jgi:hypothetical protein